jgi:hypothetical protein
MSSACKGLGSAFVVLALALGSGALSSFAAGDDISLPTRKAGLWEMKTTMDEGGGPREHTIRMCIEADMERNTVQANILEHLESCKKYEVKRGDVTTVDAECKFNGADVISYTEMRGDFTKAFEVKIKSTTIPPMTTQAQTVSIKRTIVQNGAYVGESCGELQPGEASSADGTKVMVQ